jgi:hypothetical protein
LFVIPAKAEALYNSEAGQSSEIRCAKHTKPMLSASRVVLKLDSGLRPLLSGENPTDAMSV